MAKFCSWTPWGQLREVWLGDVYPESWYDHLEPALRDPFQEITAKTKQDLDKIQQVLESFDIVVHRPRYTDIDSNLNSQGHLLKPCICPRDSFMVYGNQLFASTSQPQQTAPWQHLFDSAVSIPVESLINRINGANTVRIGRDIYLDIVPGPADNYSDYFELLEPLFPRSRIHLLNNGGHIDGCFAPIAPGLLITNKYFAEYDSTFPNWYRIQLNEPTYAEHTREMPRDWPRYNCQWYLPDFETNNKTFNRFIMQTAQDWVGNYQETYFEINCLVLDESNVLMLGENELVFKNLQSRGITAHSVPFRCRTFWDGGLHCLTLDTVRISEPTDYFPTRTQEFYTYF